MRENRFRDITDITQLEDIEDHLWSHEEANPSEETKEALIDLYRRMWELQPNEVRYERSIAQLLLGLGWDLKRRRVNYEKARRFFQQLIDMKKPEKVPIAHYRLGFIHYHNKSWDQAISSFEKALGGMSRNRGIADEWAEIDESQRIKANARLAMALKQKSIHIAKQAASLYRNYAGSDETIRIYMQELDAEVYMEEQKPYLCVTPHTVTPMNDREFRLLKDRDDAVVLDYTDYGRKYVCVSGVSWRITGRNLEILRRLMLSREPIPQWKLEDEIGINQASVYMNRLRAFLWECGLESEAITADNGYKWVHPESYLVYRSDDPDYMF